MHPAHLEYVHHLPLNSMKYFLEILDSLDAQERHEIMYFAFVVVIDSMETAQGVETKTEKGAVNMKPSKKLHGSALGNRLIVDHFCDAPHSSQLFNASDTTSIDENKSRAVEFAEFVMRTPPPPEQAEEHEKFKKWLVDHIENLSETKSKNYTQYVYFCESVVSPLLNEKPSLA